MQCLRFGDRRSLYLCIARKGTLLLYGISPKENYPSIYAYYDLCVLCLSGVNILTIHTNINSTAWESAVTYLQYLVLDVFSFINPT